MMWPSDTCDPPYPSTSMCNGDICVTLADNITKYCNCSGDRTSWSDNSPPLAQTCLIRASVSQGLWVTVLVTNVAFWIVAWVMLVLKHKQGRDVLSLREPDRTVGILRALFLQGLFGILTSVVRLAGPSYISVDLGVTLCFGIQLSWFWVAHCLLILAVYTTTARNLLAHPSKADALQREIRIANVIVPICGVNCVVFSLIPVVATVDWNLMGYVLSSHYGGLALATVFLGGYGIRALSLVLSDLNTTGARLATVERFEVQVQATQPALDGDSLYFPVSLHQRIKRLSCKGYYFLILTVVTGATASILLVLGAVFPVVQRSGGYSIPTSLSILTLFSVSTCYFIFNQSSEQPSPLHRHTESDAPAPNEPCPARCECSPPSCNRFICIIIEGKCRIRKERVTSRKIGTDLDDSEARALNLQRDRAQALMMSSMPHTATSGGKDF